MIAASDNRRARGIRTIVPIAGLALVVSWSAMGQDATPIAPQDPSVPAQAAPAQTPPPHRSGIFETLGRWLGQSQRALESQFNNTQQAIGSAGDRAKNAAQGAAGAAKEAAKTVVGLPSTRIVTGREICAVAPNGGADCAGAVTVMCRKNGLRTGRSLEVNTARKCPFQVWLYGQSRNKTARCRTETYVVQALCQ